MKSHFLAKITLVSLLIFLTSAHHDIISNSSKEANDSIFDPHEHFEHDHGHLEHENGHEHDVYDRNEHEHQHIDHKHEHIDHNHEHDERYEHNEHGEHEHGEHEHGEHEHGEHEHGEHEHGEHEHGEHEHGEHEHGEHEHGEHEHGEHEHHKQEHGHGHGHGHEHESVFQKKLQSNPFMKTLKLKFDALFPNLYAKAIAGIAMLSLPSVPIFLLLSFFMNLFKSKKEQNLSESWIVMMLSFSAGTLLGDLLLHMLPHLLEEKDSVNHILYDYFGAEAVFIYIINGIIIFLIIDFTFAILIDKPHDHSHEKVEEDQSPKLEAIVQNSSNQREIQQRNGHEKKNHNEKVNKTQKTPNEIIKTLIYLLGDLTHNFIDGMAVGASFTISTELGLVSSIAIFVHEIPHEIGDFAYLYKHNYSMLQILWTQLITSIGALVGGILGIRWGIVYKLELLGFASGAFLYLCLVNVFPELKKDLNKSRSVGKLAINVVLIYAGVFLMYLMSSLE